MSRYRTAVSRLSRLNSQINSKNSSLSRAYSQIKIARSQLDKALNKLATVRDNLKKANEDLLRKNHALERERNKLADKEKVLQRAESDMNAAGDAANRAANAAQEAKQNMENVRQERDRLATHRDQNNETITEKSQQLSELKAQLDRRYNHVNRTFQVLSSQTNEVRIKNDQMIQEGKTATEGHNDTSSQVAERASVKDEINSILGGDGRDITPPSSEPIIGQDRLQELGDYIDEVEKGVQADGKHQYVRSRFIKQSRKFLTQAEEAFAKGDDFLGERLMGESFEAARGAGKMKSPTRLDWELITEWDLQDCGDAIARIFSPTERNKRITGLYAEYYLKDPNTFKWAGMAAYASDMVGLGIGLSGFAEELYDDMPEFLRNYIGLEKKEFASRAVEFFVTGNNKVNRDIVWQHNAYANVGIDEIERLFREDEIPVEIYRAWEMLDKARKSGEEERIWDTHKLLLHYEQFVTLQPIYEEYRDVADVLTPLMFSPIPAQIEPFSSYVEGGQIGTFKDRWQ